MFVDVFVDVTVFLVGEMVSCGHDGRNVANHGNDW